MKTLCIADCRNWAIDRLVYPLRGIADVAYHYVIAEMDKKTGYNNDEDRHLSVELMKHYDTLHFNAGRNFNSMLNNPECIEVMKDKRIIFTMHNERDALRYASDPKWKMVDTVICPTRYVEETFKSKGFKTVYLPYAVDDKFKFWEEYPQNKDVIGYMGRIIPHKRLNEIVMASKGYKINACGYKDDSDYWNFIIKNGLTFTEYVPEDEKIDFMKEFAIYASITTPLIETGPLGVIECAALGIPIITTRTGWVKDNLLHLCDAYILPETEIKNLGTHIKELMQDEELQNRLRRNARKVIDEWGMSDFINAHREIYND